ncbi:hypothetical protein HMPREF9162_0028 [Selenomonas sp. oral taxon 137 str. F0430]|nr:hypothetical protein HMPREF9162_0028 [Selenomonas sp. oral taxon 137 str. F0430]
MDSWKLAKGEKVFELPETWVIFIITDGTKKASSRYPYDMSLRWKALLRWAM